MPNQEIITSVLNTGDEQTHSNLNQGIQLTMDNNITIRNTMLDAALALAEKGLHVFPLKPKGKTPITGETWLKGYQRGNVMTLLFDNKAEAEEPCGIPYVFHVPS